MLSMQTRSACVVSNCRTHDTVEGLPGYLNATTGHYNCSVAHPCLDCLNCPDCKNGKAYHSSNHGEWKPKERKARVVLSESQKQDILNYRENGSSIQDLAKQFNVSIDQIGKILRK